MSKPLDRLTLLETFARISERGSITAAARDLGISQASASRHLKELEDRFGTQLIRRTTHALTLTPTGFELLNDARGLIAGWDAMEERHGATDGGVKGSLKIVAPIALGQLYLADIALKFQIENRRVSLDWHLDDDIIRFAEIGCDCWIRIGFVPDETLVVRHLGSVERLVVANPDHINKREKMTPQEVAELPFVALSPFDGARIRLASKTGNMADFAPPIAVTTNNIFAAHRGALLGVGAAVLPRWFVEDDLVAGRLLDILPDWRADQLDINVCFLPARHQPMRLTKFLQTLADEVPNIPGVKLAK